MMQPITEGRCEDVVDVGYEIAVVGAGIIGVWQALALAQRGHRVRLMDAADDPFARSANGPAVVLVPGCGDDAAPAFLRELAARALARWRTTLPEMPQSGCLVVAQARDLPELGRFAAGCGRHEQIDAAALGALEPELAGRFATALYFADASHMMIAAALQRLAGMLAEAGGATHFGTSWDGMTDGPDIVVDCRGLAARSELADLRCERGEWLLLRSREIALQRPVRLLASRHPAYLVPCGEGLFFVGCTHVASEKAGPISVRSVLELLGIAYALHPAFGEAEIVATGVDVWPAFVDHAPRAVVRRGGRTILVNGGRASGLLLAPVLAEAVADWIDRGSAENPLLHVDV